MRTFLLCTLLLLAAALFVSQADAQVISQGGSLNYQMAGPTAEFMFRQGFAPVDYMLGQVNSGARNTAGNITTGAVLGAGAGAAIGRSGKAAAIGAGAGAAAGAIFSAVQHKMGKGQQQVIYQQQGPQALAGPAATRYQGGFELNNSMRVSCDAYDGSTFIGRMSSGDTWSVTAPRDRYRCYALIPNRRGSLSSDEVGIDPTDSGWTFVEPVVAQKGGR